MFLHGKQQFPVGREGPELLGRQHLRLVRQGAKLRHLGQQAIPDILGKLCSLRHGGEVGQRLVQLRAAVCYSPSVAAKARGHNSANIICIPADDHPDVPAIVQAFISATPLTDEKHQRRNQKLDEI